MTFKASLLEVRLHLEVSEGSVEVVVVVVVVRRLRNVGLKSDLKLKRRKQ
jgi:hypothetical protein